MTVLVTGGAGFLGRELVRRLVAAGERVVSFDRITTGAGVPEVRGDITDRALLERVLREHAVSEVVHGAAIVGVTASVAGLADAVRVNIDGSVALFEAVLAVGGVRRLVDLSSEETYGHFTADPITEDDPARPISPYGITKYAVERLGEYYAGLPYVAARLCWVYGPGFPRRRLPHPWLEDAADGRPSILGQGGDQRIDFTYVDDVVDGVLLLLHADDLAHRAYNLATGEATGLRELAAEITKLCPDWHVDLGGGPLEMAPGVTAARKGALDITRARALGYAPRVSLADGLARTLAALETAGSTP
ncbi:UDP-glucose 4-epimerase [Amycolatopsis pretoriensis]|uniref:UDP-glucose 4-epimerase n=1 Tax=Amycolatopsis pretoriensis TaxID=218821 RepID=A0A1H5R1K2_9PSEU|nr:NAD-dependent epimerase/dehydratase family protein [Amycolatopsis pretoriensis]SEF32266.1 UDP-glucose 4-epimerase [Amycolatopsis pretoriensis]